MRFIRNWGYDRRGAYRFLAAIGYLAGCAGFVWALAALISHVAPR